MLRTLSLLLLLVTLGAERAPSSASRPPGTLTLAADAEARWTAFKLTPGNQIRFTATVDGRPATALLDTGVSDSVLARAFALGPVEPGVRATAIGGTIRTGWLPTARLSFGPVTRIGGGLTVAALPSSATGSTTPIDLLVGGDLLAPYALDIDYTARRFRLLRSGRMPFFGAVAPLTVSPIRRVYESELTLGGRRLRPVVVDTGDGASVTVTRAGWAAARLRTIPVTSAISFGVAGPQVTDLAVVPELRVGALVTRDVEVRTEPAGGFSQAVGVAGRIGSGLLRNYRVLLDPGAGRMVLRPGPTADAPPPRSTSGLLLGVLPDRLRVLHVMRGGPAEATGWKADDTICAVDGEEITPAYPTAPAATWTVGEPGRVIRLRTCAGTERALTLRRFY